MKLSIGIVGLPNVGKSTLFKLLTSQEITIANYPFATIDPNVGIVEVPDERLKQLADISKSKKIIPAVVEFYDIAGLVKGASTGEGLGNQFLTHIRDTQAIVMVLRVFKNPDIIHVEGAADAVRDLEIVNAELALKDLDLVEKRIKKLEAEARTGDKIAKAGLEILTQVKAELSAGRLTIQFRDEPIMKEMQLLTSKKQVYLLNGTNEDVSPELLAKIKELGGDYLVLDLADPKPEDLGQLIRKAYEVLDLISFLTTGEDETRAWTIQRGEKAPQASGAIHTDFEKTFIRAEVMASADLLAAGGWNQAKQKGLLKVEGKDYVVKDGDVIVVRHG
jgi:ribosome-binding ATPase YchF (GTP1/OBG family)